MSINVSNLNDLKTLVEHIDINGISASIENADGWGTAGIIIKDAANALPDVMPVPGEGRPGAVINRSGDRMIVTQYPKIFVWFTKTIVDSDLQSLDPVPYLEQLVQWHLAYCVMHMYEVSFDIKDELLFICDRLIEKDQEHRKMR